MNNYELQAHLKYLSLAGFEDGRYVWMGESKDWTLVDKEIQKHEE